jgi:hypothetical protein
MMDNLARRQFRLVGKENSEVSIVKQIKCTVSNEWKVSVRRVSNFFFGENLGSVFRRTLYIKSPVELCGSTGLF